LAVYTSYDALCVFHTALCVLVTLTLFLPGRRWWC